jgi:multiple sugar transport system ATP-binding protein
MQHDTPDGIYNRPAALFVAGFTGAPPMNLVDCTVADGVADLGGARVPLPPDLARHAASAPSLKFGVRPENVSLEAQDGEIAPVRGQVQLLEPLGAETLVTFQVGSAEIVARCPASFSDAPGTERNLFLHPRHLHLFDASGGRSL